jgi:hypothetical protein
VPLPSRSVSRHPVPFVDAPLIVQSARKLFLLFVLVFFWCAGILLLARTLALVLAFYRFSLAPSIHASLFVIYRPAGRAEGKNPSCHLFLDALHSTCTVDFCPPTFLCQPPAQFYKS